jgi:predicted negative regulator of RcsB-dependent stress response
MAKNIAIVILIIFLILFAWLQRLYISTSYEQLSEATLHIEQEIKTKNIIKTNESINEFGNLWEKNAKTWMSLMLHEHVDSVYKNYLLLKKYAQNDNLSLASVYLEQLKYSLSDVEKLDELNIKNIF